MKQAATRDLYHYWNRLRGDRVSPDRSQIDPSAIRGILADTFILEVDHEQHYPFRLSGTRLNAFMMRELKGESFAELWRGRDKTDMEDTLRFVCQEAKGVVFGVTAMPRFHGSIELEMLLLPMRHLGRTHARILGCITPVQMPSWIGLIPVDHLSVSGLRILPPTPASPSKPPAALEEDESLAEIGRFTAGIGADRATVGTRYGHLVLHDFTRKGN